MNRVGYFCLNIAVALYLLANGILGFNNNWGGGGAFRMMARTIFSGNLVDIVTIILSVCGIVAGILLLLAILKVDVPVTDLLLVVFIIVWLICIVILDIIQPISGKAKTNFLEYLVQLSTHLMVLGALISSTKRFGS